MTTTTKTAIAEQQRRLGKTKRYRDRVNTMRGVIEYISNARRPLSEWRLFYAVRGGTEYFNDIMAEMREYGLIKFVDAPRYDNKQNKKPKRQYGEVGSIEKAGMKHMVVVTPNGLKFLRLTNELATLMPTAPWILENAS